MIPNVRLCPAVAALVCLATAPRLSADELPATAAEASAATAQSTALLETVGPETTLARAGRFFIESVAVEGTQRESVKRVVASEARLDAGREYSEADIAQAVRRIKRLAFVLDARPSLRRGSAPSRYQLVFEIVETAHLEASADGGRVADLGGYWDAALGVGLDRFFGSSSQLRGSVAWGTETLKPFRYTITSFTQLGLGFTQYDLVGRASRLDLDVKASRKVYFGGQTSDKSLSFAGLLLRPVSASQSLYLRFASTFTQGDSELEQLDERNAPFRSTATELGLGWAYDTTDDPFAALAGKRLSSDVALRSDKERRVSMSSPFGDRFDSALLSTKGSSTFRLGTRVGVEPNLSASVAAGEFTFLAANWTYWTPKMAAGLNLRFVEVGPRNRNRLFAQASVTAGFTRYLQTQSGFTAPSRWTQQRTLELSAGLRTRLAIVSLKFSWRNDTQNEIYQSQASRP